MTDLPLLVDPDGVARVQSALADHGLDGWLLYEFRGQNWISASLLGAGWTTRRTFALIPRVGRPKALIHAIEGSAWRHWPWDVEQYAGWREMEARLAELVDGRTRLAVEFSPGGDVLALSFLRSEIRLVDPRTGTRLVAFESISAAIRLAPRASAVEMARRWVSTSPT